MVENKPRERESSAGYHYINTYQNCPRSYYLKYYLKLMPKYTKPPLLFGRAIHKAAEVFYLNETCQIEKVLKTFIDNLSKEEYEYTSDYENDLIRGEKMLSHWYNEWGMHDRKYYETLLVEKELKVTLPSGIEMTFRPDRILKHIETSKVFIFDTKTTGYSSMKSIRGVDCEDQATGYIYAVDKCYPEWKVSGLIVDVLYLKGSVIKSTRSVMIYRNKFQLEQFEKGMTGLFEEATQKIKALQNPEIDPMMIFPRNGGRCSLFGCEYEEICRTNLTEESVGRNCPFGYTIDKEVNDEA